MKLYIAEKPSLGRAIAMALPKPHKKHQGYIEVGNGDVVSWCIGHILEQVEPESYDVALKKWQMDTLPIIPQQWQLKPKAQTKKQLTVLRKLVKQSSEIIHAGDPDREGQLLVDEVIDYLKVTKVKKSQVKRLLINDLNTPAVKKSLIDLQNNVDFMPLSISALARSRADWLYGINLTRAYTIQGKKVGFNSVLSVGRVQTPLLGLVVKREQEISQFVSKPFFEVLANIITASGEKFSAKWQPSKACEQYCDEEGRVVFKSLADNVLQRIANQPVFIKTVAKTNKKQNAPLPYSLSSLQIDAAKQFSMNAKLVLDVCQTLYEKHKLITYPRSDCRYLPKEHFKQAPKIISLLVKSPLFNAIAKSANSSLKSFAWNDKKVTAHHAIIPTLKSATNITLNRFEKNIYALIVRQYLAQFYPPYEYYQTKVVSEIAGGEFISSMKEELALGWKVIFSKPKEPEIDISKQKNDNKKSPLLVNVNILPRLKQGERCHCTNGELIEKQTVPPQSFTDATLLSAMMGIARYVSDPHIKKILKDTDGLGTEATRAGIIDLLFKRGFLQRTGKKITATKVGEGLINALPTSVTLPDMTAQWEATLNNITERKANYLSFMTPLTQTITQLVSMAEQQNFSSLPKVAFKPFKRKKLAKKKMAVTPCASSLSG